MDFVEKSVDNLKIVRGKILEHTVGACSLLVRFWIHLMVRNTGTKLFHSYEKSII